MTSVILIIDTNILHQEGLQSRRIQILKKLIKSSHTRFIIPEIVILEYITKLIDLAEADVVKIDKSVRDLKRKGVLPKFSMKYEESLASSIRSEIDNIEPFVWNWVKENNVEIYKISSTSIDKLFQSYFSGNGAFRSKKQRDDIPDAVIFDAVENIAKDQKVYFIAKDSYLRNELEKNENIICYNSLEEFISLDSTNIELEKIDNKDNKVRSVLDYLNSIEFSLNIENYFSENGIDELNNIYYDDSVILPYEFSDVQFDNIEVKAQNTYEDKEVYVYKPSYLGEGRFSVSIDITSKATIEMTCTEDGFDELPSKARKAFSLHKTEDGYLVIRAEVEAVFNGILDLYNIDFNEHNSSALEVHFSYLGAEKCAITCSLTIESVTIDDLQWM